MHSDAGDAHSGQEPHSLYAEEGPNVGSPRRRRHVPVVVVVCLVCVAAVAVPVAFALASGGGATAGKTGKGWSDHAVIGTVISALDATAASGSYDMTYSDTTTCAQPTSCSSDFVSSISGHGTVDTDPYAMVTVSDVGSLGEITLYDNGTDVWEIGGGDYGLAGPGQAGPGAPLSGYAASVEGTLGQLEGALDMQGLAGGDGYLELDAQEIQGAQPAGTGSVDGVSVTIYKLSETGLQAPDINGLTPEQVETIRAADAIIEQSGFAGKTTWVSVDSNGYIREQKTLYTLPDGSTVSGDTILSNFGCAGTVRMPGQPGSSGPPAGCVSPDSGAAAVAPTPTTVTTPTTPTTSTTPPTVLLPTSPTTTSVEPPSATTTPPSTTSPTTSGGAGTG